MKANLYVGTAFTAVAMAAAYAFVSPSAALAADGASLLAGKVVSSDRRGIGRDSDQGASRQQRRHGRGLHRRQGRIFVPDLVGPHARLLFGRRSSCRISSTPRSRSPLREGKTAKIDFTLKSKPLAYEDATASEIIAGLPGTDQQKVLFSQCSNCHTLQWALAVPRTKEDWVRVVKKMAGRAAEDETPGTYAFSQKQFIEPLAEYLTSIRGPGSSDKIPFKQRPRPTDAASTNLVVTEYALPRGGERELYMLRGDRRFVWPHDVIMNDKYAYYTDHFSYVLGRIDVKTGEGEGNARSRCRKGAGRDAQHGGRRRAPGPTRRRRARAAIRSPGQRHRRHGQRHRQIRSEDRQVHDLGGRPRHVRSRSGRQCLEPAAERRADQDRHQQRGAEADDLPDSEESGNLRHRHRFQGPHRSLHLARRQDRHLRSQDGRIRRVQDADADGRSAARADRRSGSPLGRRILRRPAPDVRSGQEGAQGIPADQRRQALHGALRGALFRERRRQEPDRVDARLQQQPPLPHRHEHRALDGIS